MHWDRFDIAEAYHLLEMHWHSGGILWERPTCARRRQSIGWQLHRMQFKPRPGLADRDDLTDNGRAIYDAALRRWGLV